MRASRVPAPRATSRLISNQAAPRSSNNQSTIFLRPRLSFAIQQRSMISKSITLRQFSKASSLPSLKAPACYSLKTHNNSFKFSYRAFATKAAASTSTPITATTTTLTPKKKLAKFTPLADNITVKGITEQIKKFMDEGNVKAARKAFNEGRRRADAGKLKLDIEFFNVILAGLSKNNEPHDEMCEYLNELGARGIDFSDETWQIFVDDYPRLIHHPVDDEIAAEQKALEEEAKAQPWGITPSGTIKEVDMEKILQYTRQRKARVILPKQAQERKEAKLAAYAKARAAKPPPAAAKPAAKGAPKK